MLFPSLILVFVCLFSLFTCRHLEFSNSLSRTLVKCENTCLLTLLGNSSLISRTNSSFRPCNPPIWLISRILSLIRSFSAFLIMSLAYCVFMPHFIFKLGGATPSSRHRKKTLSGFYVARFSFPATQSHVFSGLCSVHILV